MTGFLPPKAFTSGGLLTVYGRNFGPNAGFPVSVAIGSGVCVVQTSPTRNDTFLVCEYPPGSGSGLPLVVAAGVQAQSSDVVTFSYRPPRLISLSPNTGSTLGNVLITITGQVDATMASCCCWMLRDAASLLHLCSHWTRRIAFRIFSCPPEALCRLEDRLLCLSSTTKRP